MSSGLCSAADGIVRAMRASSVLGCGLGGAYGAESEGQTVPLGDIV
jgi:hypothetical protein